MYEHVMRVPLVIRALESGKNTRLRSSPPDREFIFGQYYGKQYSVSPIRMVRSRQWKLNRHRDGAAELHDLARDHEEIVNLAGEVSSGQVRHDFEEVLDRWIEDKQ